jgi:hypothetical protein
MDAPANILTDPIIQYGFAGMCAVLLGIVVWLIQKLLDVIRENNKIIAEHNELISNVNRTLRDSFDVQVTIKDKLNSRPCIAKGGQ